MTYMINTSVIWIEILKSNQNVIFIIENYNQTLKITIIIFYNTGFLQIFLVVGRHYLDEIFSA